MQASPAVGGTSKPGRIAVKGIRLDTGLGCNLMDPHILKTLSRVVANALSSISDRNNDNWPTTPPQYLGIPGGGGKPYIYGMDIPKTDKSR